MTCQECGTPLKDGAKFCNKCGAKQEEPKSAPQPQEAPRQIQQPAQPRTNSKALNVGFLIVSVVLCAIAFFVPVCGSRYSEMTAMDAEGPMTVFSILLLIFPVAGILSLFLEAMNSAKVKLAVFIATAVSAVVLIIGYIDITGWVDRVYTVTVLLLAAGYVALTSLSALAAFRKK